jgi:hypothetical protein
VAETPPSQPFDLERLIQELSATLGREMAESLVSKAAPELGVTPDKELSPSQRDGVLQRISEEPGLPGLAAKVLGHRIRLESTPVQVPPRVEAPAGRGKSAALRSRDSDPGVAVSLIVAHMAATLGMEKAEDLVRSTMTRLRISHKSSLPRDECDQVIDVIAQVPGLVGLAARVTKQKIRMGMAPLKPVL